MNSRYSIKDLEKLSGIKAHTLRAWEQRYDLIVPYRTETNIRYYVDNHLKKILNIAVLVKSGMRVSKVAELTAEEIRSAVIDAGRYQGNYESQINSFKVAMIDYDEYLFESVFNKCLIQFGTDETLTKILGEFIRQMGLLWHAGAINVGNEHFISSLVKQKLFSIIDQTMLPQASDKSKSYVLYLPADELHELGLLYLYYYLKKTGHRVIYLGQSVPMEYLKEVSEKTDIYQFVSIFTTAPHHDGIDGYFEKMAELFGENDYRFLLTGIQFSEYPAEKLPKRVELAANIEDLKSFFTT